MIMNSKTIPILLAVAVASVLALYSLVPSMNATDDNAATDPRAMAPMPEVPDGAQVATLGAGCFWCVEPVYKSLEGVHSVTSGYMGGHVENPTYEIITTKLSGHVEVVHVVFDPEVISYETVLDWFWRLHDPTQTDGQGADIGPQYMSTIFTHGDEQAKTAEASKQAAQSAFDRPIATTIRPATRFWPAENYHQNYYERNKHTNPYCQMITRKLQKLELK